MRQEACIAQKGHLHSSGFLPPSAYHVTVPSGGNRLGVKAVHVIGVLRGFHLCKAPPRRAFRHCKMRMGDQSKRPIAMVVSPGAMKRSEVSPTAHRSHLRIGAKR